MKIFELVYINNFDFSQNCLLIECDPAIDIMKGECGFTSGAMLNEDDLLPMVVEQDTSLTYIDKRNILEDTTPVKPDEEVKEDMNSVKIENKDDQKSQNEDDLEENISENLPKEENVPNIPQGKTFMYISVLVSYILVKIMHDFLNC